MIHSIRCNNFIIKKFKNLLKTATSNHHVNYQQQQQQIQRLLSSDATSNQRKFNDNDKILSKKRLNEILLESKKILTSSSTTSLEKQNEQPNLQNLIAEEVTIITHILKKLVGTNYSLAEIQKLYENESSSDHFIRGLIVLLISKAAESSSSSASLNSKNISSIQWRLAKIVEMIHMAMIIHKRIKNVEFETLNSSGSIETQMNLSNKISVLYGDFLWAKAWKELADMNDLIVIDMMVSVLLNSSIGQFLSEIETINLMENLNVDYWMKKNFLQNACLTAFGCRSTLKLVGIDEQLQQLAYDFGKNFGFFNQAYREIKWFNNIDYDEIDEIDDDIDYPLDICSLPIIMHFNYKNNNSNDKILNQLIDQNVRKIYKQKQQMHQQELIDDIRNGIGLKQSIQILNNFREKSLENLLKFPESDAKLQLKFILEAMEP